jgi:hypothetical protein
MLRQRSPLDNMARFQNVQPIAGGALRAGDTNKGWPGRPPANLTMRSREVSERLLAEVDRRIDVDPRGFHERRAQLAGTTGRLGGVATGVSNAAPLNSSTNCRNSLR